MKNTMNVLLSAGCFSFVFWPWAVGLVDATSWALTGGPLTNIPWDNDRGVFLVLWPIVWLAISMKVASLTRA